MEENQNIPDPQDTESEPESPVTAQEPVIAEPSVQKKEKLPQITFESMSYLSTAAKWAKFLAIMGFISVGLLALLGIFITITLTFTQQMAPSVFPFPMGLLGLIYIALAAVNFFPALYLYQFSESTKRALYLRETASMNDALNNLKRVFKYFGIMTIVVITIYILAMIFAVIMFATTFSHLGGTQMITQ